MMIQMGISPPHDGFLQANLDYNDDLKFQTSKHFAPSEKHSSLDRKLNQQFMKSTLDLN